MRKNYSGNQEKLLEFEAEGLEFAKILRPLSDFILLGKIFNKKKVG
jgi:hypothetical protein